MERKSEYRLNNIPDEAISAIKFCESSDEFLLVSSWDSSVRLLDIVDNNMVFKYMHKSPVLDCVFMVRKVISTNLLLQNFKLKLMYII